MIRIARPAFAEAPFPRLLVSVRDAAEADGAAAAGADLVDAKDPEEGALGALAPEAIRAIVAAVGARAEVSAVAGMPDDGDGAARALRTVAACGVTMTKIALPSDGTRPASLAGPLADLPCPVVAVLFAEDGIDAHVPEALARSGFAGAMIDTRGKSGTGLRDLVRAEVLSGFVTSCRRAGLISGLAGSLGLDDIPAVAALGPDYLGFRGGLCVGSDRRGRLDPARVTEAVRRLRAGVDLPCPA